MSICVCLMSHLVCRTALRFLSKIVCYGFVSIRGQVIGDAGELSNGSENAWIWRVQQLELT